jgi:hypothetical protein
MSVCKRCDAKIAWCWDDSRAKWCCIEPGSLSDVDEEFERGSPYLERWHVFHRCTGPKRAPNRTDSTSSPVFAELHLLSSAPPQVVAAAFKALALIHHPDVGGDPERMRAINAAKDEIDKLQSRWRR